MKILFLSIKVVAPSVRDGITYTFVMKEMRALVAAGVEVYFYSDSFDEPTMVEGITCFGRSKSRFARAKLVAFALRHFRFFLPRFLADWRTTLWVARSEYDVFHMIRAEGIDLIHTHFLWPAGECCELAARKLDIPILATLRGAELQNRPDLEYGAMRNPTFRSNFRSSIDKIAHFTVPNSGLAETLQNVHHVERSRVSLVFNGAEQLDIELPLRKINPIVKFVAVGRYVKLKNHAWLIETLSSLGELDFTLDIYGMGIEHEHLRKLLAQLGATNIRLCDERPKAEILEIIRDADALFHPSLVEGLPNVVIESLALGTPVIVSDIEAHRDIVQNGYNGFRFDLGDKGAFCRLLEGLVRQRSRLTSLSPNCIDSSRNFSLASKIARYLELYGELTSGN